MSEKRRAESSKIVGYAEERGVNERQVGNVEVGKVAVGQKTLACQQHARGDELMFVGIDVATDGYEQRGQQCQRHQSAARSPVARRCRRAARVTSAAAGPAAI